MTTALTLALDFGTTAVKAALFDEHGRRRAFFRSPVSLRVLPGGSVEQDPEEFVRVTRRQLSRIAAAVPRRASIASAGIACQRATIVVWDRVSGKASGPAVSWMDTRAAPLVARLGTAAGMVSRLTGLRLSPHYGAAHLARRFAGEPTLERAARGGRVVAGPVASFVLARIGREAPLACDPTLAQRTSLYDPRRGLWEPSLCALFKVPRECLPEVRPTVGSWGTIAVGSRSVPVIAMAGDQQAAAAAFDLDTPASSLAQYGTGAFVLWPARGRDLRRSGLLLSARADAAGRFYFEGTINAAGSALDAVAGWMGRARLTRTLKELSAAAEPGHEALLVPAFAGLGAPHWDPSARAVLFGAEAALGAEGLVLAALAGIAHRVADILEAGGARLPARAPIIASGPLAAIPALLSLQAAVTGRAVRVSHEGEATLRGIARLSARGAGTGLLPPAPAERRIAPGTGRYRHELRAEWRRALAAARTRS